MKKLIPALVLFLSCEMPAAWAKVEDCIVDRSEIHNGYIIRTVSLTSAQMPDVALEDEHFTAVAAALASTVADGIEVSVGIDRKQPIAVVRIPAYIKDASGNVQMRTSFRLRITEKEVTTTTVASKKTGSDVRESALNTGTW
jgi:hypothetical protein